LKIKLGKDLVVILIQFGNFAINNVIDYNSMNQKIKNIGLLAILLPLFTVALSIGYISEAYAVNTSTTGGVGATAPKAFGTSGQTCGQGPCIGILGGESGIIDETKMTPVEGGPFVKLTQVNKASANSENLYKVTYDVFAGDIDVVDLFLLVKSDIGKVSTNVGGISAEASSTTTSLIKAFDPETISVDLLRWEINS